ncbi:MAG: hypothetical protein QMB71_03620 [Tolumonas sp.]
MPLSRFVLSGLLIALVGCNTTSVPGKNTQPNVTSDLSAKLQQELPPLFTGTIQRQNEQSVFTPCGSNQQWQLVLDDNFWQQLGSPQTLQASLSGQLVAGEGRGAPFRLEAEQVSRITTDQSLCQSSSTNYLLKAGNNQPFWSLVIDGQQASLTTPDGVDSYQLDEINHPADKQLQLVLDNQSGKQATLDLRAGYCQDGSSQQWLGYSVTLQLDDGQTLTGCGEQGQSLMQQQPARNWQGRDDAQQAGVRLVLDSNYQAKMIYTRETGPEVTYEGVWQPQKGQTLRVMYNQRMGLPTIESIPFRWKDNTLTADYRELQAGKAYFDKPLVLTTQGSSTGESPIDTGTAATTPGAVIIAPPVTQEVPAGESSFAQNETILAGNVTTPALASAAVTASFSAGMLQASTQPDNAIEQSLRQFLQTNGNQASGTQYRYVKTDLNGDGSVDALIEMNWCDKSGCIWLVLQGNNGQYQVTGRLEGFSGTVMVAPSMHNGWFDVLIPSSEQANGYLVLEHDGNAYPARPVAGNQPLPDPNTLLQLRFEGDNWLTIP